MIEERVKLLYSRASGDANPHTIEAKIDRVERLGDGFRIVDYKTGGAWKSLITPKADDLQLGIYALAIADAFGIEAETLTGEATTFRLPAATAPDNRHQAPSDQQDKGTRLAGSHDRRIR